MELWWRRGVDAAVAEWMQQAPKGHGSGSRRWRWSGSSGFSKFKSEKYSPFNAAATFNRCGGIDLGKGERVVGGAADLGDGESRVGVRWEGGGAVETTLGGSMDHNSKSRSERAWGGRSGEEFPAVDGSITGGVADGGGAGGRQDHWRAPAADRMVMATWENDESGWRGCVVVKESARGA
uniref:DUF834 domain-containing protein n=1 Tax=Oryza glumipatula TaxID=40148 RepID=A0A0E0AZM3_9ORYZ